MPTFMDRVLRGEIRDLAAEIDACVDRWHQGDGDEFELHDYLGLTFEEYGVWAKDPKRIDDVVAMAKERRLPACACGTKLRTMAAQSAGSCPQCDAARRDRARADRLAREAIIDMIDPEQFDLASIRFESMSFTGDDGGVVHVEATSDLVKLAADAPVGDVQSWIKDHDGWKRIDFTSMLAEHTSTIERQQRSLDYIKTKLTQIRDRTGFAPGSHNLLDLIDAIAACEYQKEEERVPR